LQSSYEKSKEIKTTDEQDEARTSMSKIPPQEDEQPTRRQSTSTRKMPVRYGCYNLKM
jgi:hypothetical protein